MNIISSSSGVKRSKSSKRVRSGKKKPRTSSQRITIMPGRRKRVRRRRRRNLPAELRSVRIPSRRLIPYSATSGSQHRWLYAFKTSFLVSHLAKAFDSFRILSLKVSYHPDNAVNETGLCASVLLDGEGFGQFGPSTAANWFPFIGSMPGCLIRSRHETFVHTWKSTSPSSQQWFSPTTPTGPTADQILATIYICNDGLETVELGGSLAVSYTVHCRGTFYNAKISSIVRQHLAIWGYGPTPSSSRALSFEDLNMHE